MTFLPVPMSRHRRLAGMVAAAALVVGSGCSNSSDTSLDATSQAFCDVSERMLKTDDTDPGYRDVLVELTETEAPDEIAAELEVVFSGQDGTDGSVVVDEQQNVIYKDALARIEDFYVDVCDIDPDLVTG